MSKSMHSPTSRLLQSSRLFSLPRPLPQPSIEMATSTGIYRASDSATLPYPTHQVITTPASSHFRGDWGLKRPLPSKATRHTSTPHIRVRQQDNAAHITDFGSAADHSLTLAKWQQMGVPLMTHERKQSFTGKKAIQSVYDDHLDSTDPDHGTSVAQAPKPVQRWKYDGPWLPGMQEGEFEIWIMQKIAKRRDEFRKFLKDRMLKRRVQEVQKELREAGEGVFISELRKVQLRKEVEDNFELEEKRMRDDHAVDKLSSELTSAISEFLDLPGLQSDSHDLSGMRVSDQFRGSLAEWYPSTTGPPSTHPAAGLSHIRTHAVLENHPLWGPQAHRSPVLARVLRPRNQVQSSEHQAKLGVGGIVTMDPVTTSFKLDERHNPLPNDDKIRDVYKETERMVHSVEPDLEGGNKTWVHPETASVDEQGRIRLSISRGDPEAIAVATNDVEPIHKKRMASMGDPWYPPAGTQGNANYGIGLSGTSSAPRPASASRSATRGFDAELGSPGPLDENATMESIRELARSQPRTRGPPRN